VGENRKKFYPSSLLLFSSLFFLFFLWYWVQTQALMLARQVYHHLSHSASPQIIPSKVASKTVKMFRNKL
jgi:hypothetical protein